jgi:hypothetical protein
MCKVVIKFLTIERHRRYQITITSGIFVATLTGVLWPDYSYASALAGVVTNLIWIWE